MAADDDDAAGLAFYPAFCYKASPTHFAWVKMAVVDVHRLKTRAGFEGQNIYFYYNHPIQFVCLAGVIVARTEYPWRTVLMLDDGSGETIEVVVSKAASLDASNRAPEKVTVAHAQAAEAATKVAVTTAATTDSEPSGSSAQAEMQHVSSQTKDPINITDLIPGAVLKAKGTLSTFRSTMQVQLERFALLRETNAEMRFWDEQSRYLVDVLSVPWRLEPDEVEQLRREAEQEEERIIRAKRRLEEKRRRATDREERDRIKIQRRWEREERLREEATSGAERKVLEEVGEKRTGVRTAEAKRPKLLS